MQNTTWRKQCEEIQSARKWFPLKVSPGTWASSICKLQTRWNWDKDQLATGKGWRGSKLGVYNCLQRQRAGCKLYWKWSLTICWFQTKLEYTLCKIDRLVQSKLITNLVCDLKEWECCIGLFRFSGAGELVNWINGEQRVALDDINHSGRCSELTDWIWRL